MRGFVRQHLKKTVHVEKITLVGHVITCSCGEPWFAATEARNAMGRETFLPLCKHACPSCGKAPTPATTSAREEREESVSMTPGGALPGLHGTGRVR